MAPSLQPLRSDETILLSDTLQVSVMMVLVINAQVAMCITVAGSNVKIASAQTRTKLLLLFVAFGVHCNRVRVRQHV